MYHLPPQLLLQLVSSYIISLVLCYDKLSRHEVFFKKWKKESILLTISGYRPSLKGG